MIALRDGVLLVVIILVLFLMNVRTTFITLTAIPLSLVITALVFAISGMSINTMTLGGLAVALGEPFAAPSANRFGRVSPTTAEHVRTELGAEVDLILDGGPSAVGVESTIIDVTHDQPRLLRPGGVSIEAIEKVIGRTLVLATDATDVRAPGMLESHYAPRAGLWLVSEKEIFEETQRRQEGGARVVVIAPEGTKLPEGAVLLPVPSDEAAFARLLYTHLREADALGDLILAVPPPESGLGLAVLDRLRRASVRQ